jgi:5-dehydro-2-deoxygluconokinase
MSDSLDLVAIGRVSVDLYGQQLGSRLEDVASFAKAIGGSPANIAIGAARLGLKTALITRVGDEPMGRFVREQLRREGVDTRGVRTDGERLTSLVLLSVRDAQTFPLIFYRENCADSALCEDDIDAGLIAGARAVLVTGTHFSIAAGAQAQRKAIAIARAQARRVVLDIDYRPNLWGIGGHDAGESRYARSARVTAALAPVLPECDLIVGTEEEMHIAAGREDTLEAVRRIRALSTAVIVVKRGAQGCVVFEAGIPERLEDALSVPGFAVEIYNVLGAGDAFLAGFLRGYLRDEPHAASARFANACGAIAVSRLMCSSEFATLPELAHYLARGSSSRALRHDPELQHLHWATTRGVAPSPLFVLNAVVPAAMTGAAGEQLAELGRLTVEAAAKVAAARAGVGVRLDASPGPAALALAQRHNLWLAREVQAEALQPAERLLEWPMGITVSGRCRAAHEQRLVRLAAACRAQGRELLLEIDAADPAAVMTRLYELGVRPDWWALAPSPDAAADSRCAQVIAAHDGYCRGVLVTADAPGAAAASPIVRGFITGGSILAGVAPAWLAGRLSDESLIREVADRFHAQIAAWLSGARGATRTGLEGNRR